jgi:hypothetical protein
MIALSLIYRLHKSVGHAPISSVVLFCTPFILVFFVLKVRGTLRLAVYRQSVRLSAKPFETHGQNFFFQLNSCDYSPYVTFSLTKA